MIGEKYTIEVSEGIALIHGTLTIQEAFDFLNYFDKQGFTQLIPGDENSCLMLRRKEPESEKPLVEETNIYESFYEQEQEKNKNLSIRIQQLESLIKQLLTKKSPETPELIKFLSGFSCVEEENE